MGNKTFYGDGLKPRLNGQTSSNSVLDEAAIRSNIVRRTKCWMKMFELDMYFVMFWYVTEVCRNVFIRLC